MKKSFVLGAAVFTMACFGLAAYFAQSAGEQGMTAFWTSVVSDATKEAKLKAVTVSLEASKINELQLKVKNDDLKIEESADDKIHILFHMRTDSKMLDESEILKEVSDGVYSIDLDELETADKDVRVHFVNVLNFNVQVKDTEVVVQLPRTIKRVKPGAVSGSLKITLDADEIEAGTISGDLRIQGLITKLTANSISGDAELELKKPATLATINTVSGDVKVVLESEPDFMLDFETASGELAINQLGRTTRFEGSVDGQKFGNGAGKISIKTVSGDVRISKEPATE